MEKFDYVICEMPLPDGLKIDRNEDFRERCKTTDLSKGRLDMYIIHENGEISISECMGFNDWADDKPIKLSDNIKSFDFYNISKHKEIIKYKAIVRDGKVVEIVMHPEHHAFEKSGRVKQSHYKVEIWNEKKNNEEFFDTFENAFAYCKQDLQNLCDGSLKKGEVRICKLIPFSSPKYPLPAVHPGAKDAICYQEVFCVKSMNECMKE